MSNLLTDKKFVRFVRTTVAESVQQLLTDPDFGLKLSPSTTKRLTKHKNTARKNLKTLTQIKKKHLK